MRQSISLYESKALRWIAGDALRPGGLALTREALDLCAFAPGARLLDAGCGPGATLALLRRHGHAAFGMDHSPALSAEARMHGPVLRADLHALPIRSASLDGVFCECVLSLTRDFPRALAECARVLRPGGKLVLSDLMHPLPQNVPLSYSAAPDPFPPCSCAAGALPLPELTDTMRSLYLRPVHILDRTRFLRELAARMVLHAGSVAAFLHLAYTEGAAEGQGSFPAVVSAPGSTLPSILSCATQKDIDGKEITQDEQIRGCRGPLPPAGCGQSPHLIQMASTKLSYFLIIAEKEASTP